MSRLGEAAFSLSCNNARKPFQGMRVNLASVGSTMRRVVALAPVSARTRMERRQSPRAVAARMNPVEEMRVVGHSPVLSSSPR